MASFETVAREYDLARPSYPARLYDVLGDLEGSVVLDVGAGTGLATRQLVERGARAIAVDRGKVVLGHAVARTPGLAAAVADGAVLPIRAGTADLICYAQAWHWLDQEIGLDEAHRVLRAGGRWAAWWSHARADGEEWFDAYFSLIERSCPGTHREQRDTDWGATVAASPLFHADDYVAIPWIREISVEDWMTDQVSHSYMIALAEDDRRHLVDGLRQIVEAEFPGGRMSVPYETWCWTASKIDLGDSITCYDRPGDAW